MSTVRETSIEAFHSIQPKLKGRRRMVFNAIVVLQQYGALGAPTDLEIAQECHFRDPNRVRPRRRELVQMGIIEEAGKRECSVSHQNVLTWRTCLL